MKIHLLTIISILFLSACSSDYFEEWTLRNARRDPAENPDSGVHPAPQPGRAYALGDYRNIDVFAWNGLTVTGEKGVAIALGEVSEHVHDLTITLPEGGVEIMKRVSRYDGGIERGEGLRYLINNGNVDVLVSGKKILGSDYNTNPDHTYRIRLIENGYGSVLIMGRDTLSHLESGLIATENTVIKPINPQDTVLVQGIDMYSTVQWDRPEFLTRKIWK